MWREAQPWCLVIADSGTVAGSGPRPKAAPRPAVQGLGPVLQILGSRPRSGPVRGEGEEAQNWSKK